MATSSDLRNTSRRQLLMLRMRVGEPDSEIKSDESEYILVKNDPNFVPNMLKFSVKDSIFPLLFISTKPAKTEVSKPLVESASKETQTTVEEGLGEERVMHHGHEELVGRKLDLSNSSDHECGSKRKILKMAAIVAAAAALVVIVVCVVAVAWHGNRL